MTAHSLEGRTTRWREALCEARRIWASQRLADRIMVATLLLTLGFLAVFGTAGYLALRQSEMRRMQALLDGSAHSVRYEVERSLSVLTQLISGVAGQALVSNALADVRHGDDLVHPFLRDAVRTHPEVSSIALIDYRGDIVSAFGTAFHAGVSMPEIARRALDTAKPQTFFIPVDHGIRMVMAYPVVYLTTGNVEGAIVAEVVCDKLMPASIDETPLPFAVKLVAGSGLLISERGQAVVGDALRVEVPVGPLKDASAQVAMKLITETPREQALATLRQLQQLFTAMVVLALITSIYFSRRLASRIATPIVALRNAAHAATEQGHAALQTVPVFGEGEVADLARSFNDMGRALQEAHAELEQKVEVRTRELREARERLKEIFDSVAEVVYAASPDFSVVDFVSAASMQVMGLPAERFTAEPGLWVSMIHDEDREAAVAAHGAGMRDDGSEVEYRIVRPDGKVRWLRDRFTVNRDEVSGEVTRIQGTATDITAAVEANQARLRAEEVLRTLHRAIQASSAGVIISDTSHPDNPVIMVNPAFERITGYRQDEVIGHNCRFLQGPDTKAEELLVLRAALRDKRECKVILKNYRKDGSAFWNELSIAPVEDGSGRITQFVGIMNDITPLVDTQNQLQQWAERLDAIFTLSPDGFISLDEAGCVSFANPAIERMTGYPARALVGMEAGELDRRLAALADPAYPYPETDCRHGCEAVVYLQRPQPIILKRITRRAQAGRVSTIIYFHDVTREMEVDRMKSEFLTTAAHELRTPMASVMGFSELLMKREFPREVQQEYLEIINRQSKRLTSLLNDLLDLARIEARRRGALSIARHRLDDIVRDALASLMVPGDKRAVELELSGALPEVEVDAAKIQQALTNLLSNAYKYSPQGGRIRVSDCHRVREGREEIGLQVQDEGIGMTPAQLARAFERFFRADDTGSIPGTGLGLSLVKEIIETHGGEVTLKSTAGQGTVATIWLPVASTTAAVDVEETA